MPSTGVSGPFAAYNLQWLRATLEPLIEGSMSEPHEQAIGRLVALTKQLAKASQLAPLLNRENPVAEVDCPPGRLDLQRLVLTRLLCFRLAQTGREIVHALKLVGQKRSTVGGSALSPKESALSAALTSKNYSSFVDQLAAFSGEEGSKPELSTDAYAALVNYGLQQQFTKGIAQRLKAGAITLRILEKVGVVQLPAVKAERQHRVPNVNLSMREITRPSGHHHGSIPLTPNGRF